MKGYKKMGGRERQLLLAKLEAIRKEVAGSELAPEHRDQLQCKIDEAVRLLEMPEEPIDLTDVVRCIEELKQAMADRIGHDVRAEVRAAQRMRQTVYAAVREAVAEVVGQQREAEGAGGQRLAQEVAELEAVPWLAVLKRAALSTPKAFFAAVAVVMVYLILNGFGERLLELLHGVP